MKKSLTLYLVIFGLFSLTAQPANDGFCDAIEIALNTTVTGSNVDATAVANTVQCNDENSHNSVWYYFIGNGNEVNINTCSSNTTFDTDLAVMLESFSFGGCNFFLGCAENGANASGTPMECSFGGSNNALAQVNNFSTVAGFKYYIRLASHVENSTGTFDIEVSEVVAAPVTLVGFWATTLEKGNSVTWETSSEENVLWHVIERSSTGYGNWEEAGKLVSETSARNGAFYELIDDEPFNTTYYRLRTVDYDASEQLSDIISIKRDRPEFDIKKVYPNPIMEGEVTVQIDSDRNEDINIRVVDVNGKTIQKFEYPVRDGLNEMKIDVTDFRSGVYFVQFQSRQGYSTRKIFKQE